MNRFHTTSSISSGEVASLDHEVLNHTVELAALVTESFLLWRKITQYNLFMHFFRIWCNCQTSRCINVRKDESTHLSCSQGDEILSSLWDGFSEQPDDNAPYVLISNPHIEVHLRQDGGITGRSMSRAEMVTCTKTCCGGLHLEQHGQVFANFLSPCFFTGIKMVDFFQILFIYVACSGDLHFLLYQNLCLFTKTYFQVWQEGRSETCKLPTSGFFGGVFFPPGLHSDAGVAGTCSFNTPPWNKRTSKTH